MGVPGPKLMDDEKFTQDFLGVCTPTFVTPDTRANADAADRGAARHCRSSISSTRGDAPHPRLPDAVLWNETQYNPLGHAYFSCVPYLLGEGQAMKYSLSRRKTKVHRKIPRVPFRPPDNYLRDNMVKTLDEQRRRVRHAGPGADRPAPHADRERRGAAGRRACRRCIPVATLRIPRQNFDSPEQLAFARNLSFNPWHCIPEHRPLGNQSRARRRMY